MPPADRHAMENSRRRRRARRPRTATVDDDGQRAAEEQRDPRAGEDEQDAAASSAAARRRSCWPWRTGTGSRRTARRCRSRRTGRRLDAGAAADVGEEAAIWNDRRDEEGRDEDPRAEPVEQGAVAGQPAEDEDAPASATAHVSARRGVAPSGVSTVSAQQRGDDRAVAEPRRAGTARSSSHGSAAQRPPRGSPRTPQVGGEQPGDRVAPSRAGSTIGTRNPQMSQTGISSAVPSAHARAVAHGGDREQEAEQRRSASTVAGADDHEQQRVRRSTRRCRTRSGPTAGSRPCCRARPWPSTA